MIMSRDYVISELRRVNINPMIEPGKALQYFVDNPVPHFGRNTVRSAVSETASTLSRSQTTSIAMLPDDITRKIDEMSRQVREMHDARSLYDSLENELENKNKEIQRLRNTIKKLLEFVPIEKRTEIAINLLSDTE
jgi:predicted esterase YcpF (UPF0227 family)